MTPRNFPPPPPPLLFFFALVCGYMCVGQKQVAAEATAAGFLRPRPELELKLDAGAGAAAGFEACEKVEAMASSAPAFLAAGLPYTSACVKESLRLHPPAPLFFRVCCAEGGAEVGGFQVGCRWEGGCWRASLVNTPFYISFRYQE